MTRLAIVFMLTSVTRVTVLVAWCYYPVLSQGAAVPPEKRGPGGYRGEH